MSRSKADTLAFLAPQLGTARVLEQLCCTVAEWRDARASSARLWPQPPAWLHDTLIVRSSALNEDTAEASNAGRFESLANIQGSTALDQAIGEVIASYGSDPQPADQVLIQPMLQDVAISGVLFSCDPSTGGDYYVVNYDDRTGSTSSVTDGSGQDTRVCYAAKCRPADITVPDWMQALFTLTDECEALLSAPALDIEFAWTQAETLYLFQARPLVLPQGIQMSRAAHREILHTISRHIARHNRPQPYLCGKRAVYGVMPDWNPAEIIGVRPKPLALSLYKELITDQIWAYQRHNYGYRNLRSFPLLQSFSGQPFIDVRVSFNSFIPEDIEEDLADRLVNHYLDRLQDNPHYHDKVEFEILLSCYTLDIDQRLGKLQQRGFSQQDCLTLQDSLRQLTNRIIHGKHGLWRQDREKLAVLQQRQQSLMQADLDPLDRIYWLIEDCKRYGTLPFAGLARAGFIAVQMLRSMVVEEVISEAEYQSFMAGLDTVSSRIGRDLSRLSKEAFLQTYGHLRPGTYDICCPRYDEDPDTYFSWSGSAGTTASPAADFSLSIKSLRKLESLLKKHQLEHNVLSLFDFIQSAIEGREYAKFLFSRSLSESLRLIQQLGQAQGWSVDDLSHLNIRELKKLYGQSDDVAAVLKASIAQGKQDHQQTLGFRLPPLIRQPDDIWCFELPLNSPNFITLASVTAKVIYLTTGRDHRVLQGSIVLIEQADPGFDWLFSHHISGLVTMYGGANSHMAIRAGELAIPAVIGAGEKLFQRWQQAEVLRLDCANHSVTVIR